MTSVKFISIIILFSSDIHSIKAEKITVMKCCYLGEYVLKNTCKSDYLKHNFDITKLKLYSGTTLNLSLSDRSLRDFYELEPGIFNRDEKFKNDSYDYSTIGLNMYLTEMGTLYIEEPNEYDRWKTVNTSNFCVDYLIGENKEAAPRFWVILPFDDEKIFYTFYVRIGLLTSCVFLALLMVVYSLLPELRNLSGLVLMAYVASLFSAFLLLAAHQFGPYSNWGCQLLTYFCYFSFLASFCWMNIMSYDIWWTFRGFAKTRPVHRFEEWYKFKVYCAYAFGVPLAMTVFFATVDQVPMRHLPWFITPKVGNKGCFMTDKVKLLYLYIPMMILILMNWFFFLLTSYEIWSLHQQTAILDTAAAGTRAAHRQQRARLLVYLKLSIIMGVNWVLEVISSFSPTLQIWKISDAYNFLIGISIFFIFICKKKILRKLKKRCRAWRGTDTDDIGNKSQSSSDVSQKEPLQVCPHPDVSFKQRTFRRRNEFN